MKKFNMNSLIDPLPSELFPSGQELSQEEHLAVLKSAVQSLISEFIDISFPKMPKKVSKNQDIISLNMQKKF